MGRANPTAELILLSVCLRVCVGGTFVVFIDCESCTRPISTNLESMEAGEYGLTRGTCFVAHRLEVVVVAGMLWISCFFPPFFFLRTHTARCKYALPHLPLY